MPYLIGALIGATCTGLMAGLLAEYERRHTPQPEPQRVTPTDITPITDRLAALARTMRAMQSRGAADVAAAAHDVLNLERRARGLPPMAGPRITAAEDVSRPR